MGSPAILSRRNDMCSSRRIIVLVVLSLIILLSCGNSECREQNCEFTPEVIRVGYSTKFFNDVGIADAQIAMELWTRELSKGTMPALRMQPKPFIYDYPETLVRALKNRELELVATTATDYLKIKDKVPLEPALSANRQGSGDGDEMVLLVRRDNQITDLGQLKGKRLAVHAGYMLDSAHLWLSTVLSGKNLPEQERFFGSVLEVKKTSQAVLPVFFRQADACLVSKNSFQTMVELNPQIGKELTVLLSSNKLMYGMLCFHRYLNADIKTQVINSALNMHTTVTGKQILTLFQIDRVTPFKMSLLDTTLSLLDKQNSAKGKLLVKKQR
jgi:ABC-type phosphate/phosphonate transport system substrate-binding protein